MVATAFVCRGCHKDVPAVNQATAYCPECQAFHEECMARYHARRAADRLPDAPRSYGTLFPPRRRYVGVGPVDVDDMDGMTEADWADALHPNEGCL